MSYRSLKRVLGETHLERKCRLTFGAALVIVLLVAFSLVYWIAHSLVSGTTQRKGRDLVDTILLKAHWEEWETDEKKKEFVEQMIQRLETQTYEHQTFGRAEPPHLETNDLTEREMLLQLELAFKAELAAQAQSPAVEAAEPPAPGLSESPPAPPTRADDRAPLFASRRVGDQYHYYQPVLLAASCTRICHAKEREYVPDGVLSVADTLPPTDEPTIRIVKVSFSTEETTSAEHWTIAVLSAAGIITFFLAMVALYAVVRYVVVKPLTHLRDVSEQIGRGKTELRAELQTGDEFQELADSFNRMLRHLTQTQTELQSVNSDLDAKVDQLAQLNMRLYEMNQLKGEFLANMSHELRTPLNSIIGFSEVLQGLDALSERQKRYAQNIQKSGRLLLEMINDILDFAKLEAGKMEVRAAEFDLAAFVSSQCEMVRPLTDEKNIDLKISVESDAPAMYQDQQKVQQILTNLLSNAIKFTPEGGRIEITAERDRYERMQLTVADTGVGIAAEDLDVIFEKFRQALTDHGADNFAREHTGTGLGLSIVKESCKLLGGEVSVQSEVGMGSTFTVVLPWTLSERPPLEAEISARLDELARSDDATRAREPSLN